MNKIKKIILLLFIGCSVLFPFNNEKQYSFDHISYKEGLSQVIVSSILQDSKGFIWIGTFDGLNRYDGKNFVVYKHDPDNFKSISSSDIITIIEGKDGYLWIGTRNGLNRFDRKKMKKMEQKYEKENTINKLMFKHNISKREREIVDLVVKGKSSKEIEDELYISLSTVNNHIHSILKKMKLKNRGELIVLVKTV